MNAGKPSPAQQKAAHKGAPAVYLSQQPGYSEAIAEAAAKGDGIRDFSFLGLPKQICGIDVLLVTLRQYCRLHLLKNYFVCGGEFHPGHMGQVLWLLSPHYIEPWRAGITRVQLNALKNKAARRCDDFLDNVVRPADEAKVKVEIAEYFDEMLYDAPGGGDGQPMVTSYVAVFIEIIAGEYGWSEDQILDLPMQRIYQHVRCILRRKYPTMPIIDRRVDKIKREYALKSRRQRGRKAGPC